MVEGTFVPQMLWRISRSRGFGFLREVEALPEGKDGAGGTGGTSPKLAGRSSLGLSVLLLYNRVVLQITL